jgi:hypothetical protein
MPMATAVQTFVNRKVLPLWALGDAREEPINLGPGLTLAAGTLLGEITSASTNDVQTATVNGGPTGGTFTLTGTLPSTGGTVTTAAIAYNAAATAVQAALVALFGAGNVTATGAGGGPYTITFLGAYAGQPVPVLAMGTNALTGGTTPNVTVAHTTTGRSKNTYAAYNDANANGTQAAKSILPYAVATDASGRVTYGGATGGNYLNAATEPHATAYFSGYFRTTDLVGLDAAAVADLGRLVSGTVADGVLCVYGA